MENTQNDKNNQNIKIQLFKEKDPFIFIQHDLFSKRYRISTNFEYLNKEYNLKLQYIRNFDELHTIIKGIKNSQPLIETIKHSDSNNTVYFTHDKMEEIVFKHNFDNNKVIFKIQKLIFGSKNFNNRSVIIIFNKIVNNDSNYSLFFASEHYYKIEDILSQYPGNNKKEIT